MAKIGLPRKRAYSVLLVYPDYVSDGLETFYTHVKARDPKGAVHAARMDMLAHCEWSAGDGGEINDLDDIGVELVLEGHHKGLSYE